MCYGYVLRYKVFEVENPLLKPDHDLGVLEWFSRVSGLRLSLLLLVLLKAFPLTA